MDFDPMTFKCENTEFDTYSAKSKQFYSLLIVNKAKYPNSFKTLSADLQFSNPLQEVFSIPYNVASETFPSRPAIEVKKLQGKMQNH